MSKKIVICCDGTGNEIGKKISNVLKLYRILKRTDAQRVYYNPGVGTIGQQNAWQRFRQNASAVFGLATGYGLDNDILSAYRFLAETYEPGDKVYLFGFSRGAYTVRALAAFTHVMGLLPRDQLNLATYALSAYKRASSDSQKSSDTDEREVKSEQLAAAWDFSRVAGGRPIRIEFIGVWDTVASVIVPRKDQLLPNLQTLRFTRTNPSVHVFRQAIAIDERRRMFRLNRWIDPQPYQDNPFDRASAVEQNIRQVWFAGVHSDVGGGYAEEESALSKYPLIWMIQQASDAGLDMNDSMLRRLAFGQGKAGDKYQYAKPDATADMHDSMNAAWRVLEWLPKQARWRDDKSLPTSGWYLPRSEPRLIPEGAILHHSVIERKEKGGYGPPNLPSKFEVEGKTQLELSNST